MRKTVTTQAEPDAARAGSVASVGDMNNPAVWCKYHGVPTTNGRALVYKAVSSELVAGQGHNPTTYTIGSTVEAPDWKPTRKLGHGLHFCASPRQAVFYVDVHLPIPAGYNYIRRNRARYRFLACEIDVATAVPLGEKIKAPACRVLYEVDIHGERVEH